ncbi:alpha,alpha-trehalose-phosphate synthase [UDP-forming] 1-like [Chenopodium quinoa]|uniref:alpha,alpha-trehalose-phosphate synthase [UDP-forming] 1-like n=1 Tax=Chenopodium quinoa TaxID=63459 RepID=UPI000B793B38|nr:alpha,alpha-trehalose-phosphate synthase [UDP-forming] 1-like [Chenopodium quinoa]
MPGNKYNGDSNAPTSRISRLLELRQLKRANRANNEISDDNNSPEPGGGHDFSYVEKDSADAVAGSPSQRLLVVAKRLPVSAVRRGEDSWSLEVNVGGLVTALLGVKEFEARWIGWAGVNVPDEVGQKALTKALAEKRCIPVFLDEELVHQYYNGYCNNILWPLFHYLGLPQEDRLATTRSFQSQFAAYKKANQMFADVVNQHYEEGDIVWCHDYHLMFLPECLKRHNSKMKVGWFLHTPFPSSEIHRTLPSRSELLRAVLAADLVGFHTYDYARHFVSSCTHILGLEGRPEGVEDDQGRLTRVVAFPIGIDSDRFIRALKVPQVQENIKELVERFAGQKVMLGVDRLDMIKGIPQKILAFEKFLEENPYWRDRVVLLQIAVPTRTDVTQYQKLTSQVHEIVGRINGRFGTFTRVPIHHLDRSLDFHALCALYAVTDVALVTSLRDGMNLVSYEFVACQDEKKGVLILSEFAGAAQSLGAGALLVNPWNITEVAAAIGKALNMSDEERTNRHQINFSHVTEHTAQEWAEFIVSELKETVEAQLRITEIRPVLPVDSAVNIFLNCSNRLLILGFNAALTEAIDSSGRRGGDQVKDMNSKLNPELKGPLSVLCNDPNSTIVILSGSRRIDLVNNFGEYDMWLAAEHGMFLRHTRGDWKTTMPEHLNLDWVPSVYHIFEYFKERTPRSTIELRDISVVWNYKYADFEFRKLQARDMLQHLWTGPISNAPVEVVPGSTSVEVRPVGITKGSAIDLILGEIVHSKPLKSPIDYVSCIGHFLEKDEDVYTFFEPELPNDNGSHQFTEWPSPISPGGSKASHGKTQHSTSNTEKTTNNGNGGLSQKQSSEKTSWNVLDLKKDNYFSCAVGRTRTSARYTVGSSDEVVSFLTKLAEAYMSVSSTL